MVSKVILYSTPMCPYCHMAADFLKQNNVKYVEYDVSSDHAKAKEMIQKSGQTGVPVIDIDGTVIPGFDVPEIKKALGLK
ncbi:MAG: glutaredoxin domain-containing protein [Candidatus Micrarchaeota archaeon]